jgi:hypothetical protein
MSPCFVILKFILSMCFAVRFVRMFRHLGIAFPDSLLHKSEKNTRASWPDHNLPCKHHFTRYIGTSKKGPSTNRSVRCPIVGQNSSLFGYQSLMKMKFWDVFWVNIGIAFLTESATVSWYCEPTTGPGTDVGGWSTRAYEPTTSLAVGAG